MILVNSDFFLIKTADIKSSALKANTFEGQII